MTSNAQNLDKHQWENRIIIIKTTDENNAKYQKQIEEFKNEENGLLDRKLVLYKVVEDTYSFSDFNSKSMDFQTISNPSKRNLFKHKHDFEVLLIGLDGGVKIVQQEVLTIQKLFNTIDAMPMRQNELNNRN
jgi:hypothetical protein